MRWKLLQLMVISYMIFFAHCAWALSIISPQENQVFDAGSRVDVVVKPDAGDKWEKVVLAIYPMSYNMLSEEYKETIEIPQDELGVITITVVAVDVAGREVELRRNIISKMPLNVVLTSIRVSQDFMVLYKLPASSNIEDAQRIESRQLSVSGIYSDGVKRKLTSSDSGTTYVSSNEQIVTVSPDGKVNAKGLGEAKITVKNGNYSVQVDIEVIPYKQPQR